MLRQVCRSAALCLLLTGCGEITGTVVDMQTAEVSNLLYHLPSKADLMEMPFLSPAASRTIDQTETGVVWTYAAYGKDECNFAAHVKRETETSNVVWSDVEELGNGDRAYLCDAVQILGEESIAATLEGRAADEVGMQRRLAAAVANNVGSVQKSIFEEVNRSINAKPDNCHLLQTSADQAACNGDRSLKEPKSGDR